MDLQTLDKRGKCLLKLPVESERALSEASITSMQILKWAERMVLTGVYQPRAQGTWRVTSSGNLRLQTALRTNPYHIHSGLAYHTKSYLQRWGVNQ